MEPKNIHIVMTKLKKDGKYGLYEEVFPTLSQIRSYSSQIKKNLRDDDDETVVKIVKEMEYYPIIDETVTFRFGCKCGNNYDNDHLIYNFTSIALLKIPKQLPIIKRFVEYIILIEPTKSQKSEIY